MKARKLLAEAVYNPADLRIIGQVFDDAWDEVARQVSNRPEVIEAARLKLAEIVLSVRRKGTYHPQQLAEQAVRLMLAEPTELK